MEEGVVLKIEDNLKGIVGVERVTSVSRENAATISVETEKGENIDVVLADVKNAVDRVPTFPTGMEPPVIAALGGVLPFGSIFIEMYFIYHWSRVDLKKNKEVFDLIVFFRP